MLSKSNLGALAFLLVVLFTSACQPSSGNEDSADEASQHLPYTTTSDEALAQFKNGLTPFDLGDQQNARRFFDKAIELDPDFAVAYVYRSFTSRSPKEFAADVKMANEKNKDLSKADSLMVELANGYLSGDLEKRMTVSQSLVESYPDAGRSYMVLGQTYQEINDPANARKNYAKAISLNPDWIAGYSALGGSYVFDEPKDLAKAEENMLKVVELMPNESRSHIALGDVYRAQQKLDMALAEYRKAAELSPDDPVAYSKAGHANTFMGNYDEARKDFEKSGTLSSYPAADLNFRAFTYLYAGEQAQGLAWLKEHVDQMDMSGLSQDRQLAMKNNLISNCMWMAYNMGNVDEVKSLVAQIQPVDYENTASTGSAENMMEYNARMNFRNGLIAVLEGNFDMAKEKAEAQKSDLASINDPTKLENYYFLKGEIAMGEGNYADAVTFYEQSDKYDMYTKYKLAMANMKAGNDEKANQLLNEIAGYNFNDIGYALVRHQVQEMLAQNT